MNRITTSGATIAILAVASSIMGKNTLATIFIVLSIVIMILSFFIIDYAVPLPKRPDQTREEN